MLDAVELLEHGLPPVGGGSLDQTACFAQCLRFIRDEEAAWKAKLGIR